MSRLVSNRSQVRTEAQTFFAVAYPSPFASAAAGLLALVDVACAVATLVAL